MFDLEAKLVSVALVIAVAVLPLGAAEEVSAKCPETNIDTGICSSPGDYFCREYDDEDDETEYRLGSDCQSGCFEADEPNPLTPCD